MKGPLEAVIEDMQTHLAELKDNRDDVVCNAGTFERIVSGWVTRLLSLCKVDPQKTRVINLKGELMAEFPDRLRMSPDQKSIYLGQTPYEVVSTTYNGHDMTVQVRA